MKSIFLAIICFLGFIIKADAQSYVIKGAVRDTLNDIPLRYACVTLLGQQDSILKTFCRADDSGRFELRLPQKENCFLIISFPGFPDYFRKVNMPASGMQVNLGTVALMSRTNMLQEFVVTKNRYAVSMTGDTVQFMADSFKVKDYATVADLLKRLPGIDVDRNGSITAYNRPVEKVLIDGEEFFSEDPGVVIKSFLARQVNKVQVYDTKSAHSEFTGIDDGQRIKTINLRLKDSARRQLTGKLDGGSDFSKYYKGDVTINRLNDKEQVSVSALATNTDIPLQELTKNSSSENTLISGGAKMRTTDMEDPGVGDGQYHGLGLPQIVEGGVHYANKWDSSGLHINVNYKVSDQQLDLYNKDFSQYLLTADSSYNVSNQQHTTSNLLRHKISIQADKKLNANTTIKIYADAGYTTGTFRSEINKSTTTAADTLNRSLQDISSDRSSQYANAALVLEKRFQKKGRTLSLTLKENYRTGTSDNYITSANMLKVSNGAGTTQDSFYTIDQHKKIDNTRLALAGDLYYTEPLSRNSYLELSYGILSDQSSAVSRSVYRPSGDNTYSQADTAGSSNFDYSILINKAGLSLHHSAGKINITLGSSLSLNNYIQQDMISGSTKEYHNTNIYPQAHLVYNISKENKFYFHYNGSVVQPSMEQVQPTVQNTDPLNITVGNTDLKPQFINSFSTVFSNLKPLHSRSVNVVVNFSSVSNAIILATATDASGKRTSQYRNTEGNYNGSMVCSYSTMLNTHIKMGSMLGINLIHENNIINEQQLANNTTLSNVNLRIGYIQPEKYSIDFSPGAGYSFNSSGFGADNARTWNYNAMLDGWIMLPAGIELATDVSYSWQPAATLQHSNSITIWNAAVSRRILKKRNVELRVSVNDLLGQRNGYTRTIQNALINEHTYNLVPRHVTFTAGWNFNRNIRK